MNLAPDLTLTEEKVLARACREPDKARRRLLGLHYSEEKAFQTWRRIAEQGLPVRCRPRRRS